MHTHEDRSSWPAALAAVAAALALPVTARPATTLTVTDPLVSIAECVARDEKTVSLSWDLGSASGSSIELLGSSASGCSDSDATTAVLVEGLSSTQTSYPRAGDTAITLTQVLDAAGKTPPDGCEGSDQYVYVCVQLLDSSGTKVASASASIKLQLRRPPAPQEVEVVGVGEQSLYVSFRAGTASGAATAASKKYQAFAALDGNEAGKSEETTSTSQVPIRGLENGTTYDVWVIAYSEAGNASDRSEQSAGTPQHTLDFFQLYRSRGGAEQGGCNQGGSFGLLATLCAAWMLRRRVGARRPKPGPSDRPEQPQGRADPAPGQDLRGRAEPDR